MQKDQLPTYDEIEKWEGYANFVECLSIQLTLEQHAEEITGDPQEYFEANLQEAYQLVFSYMDKAATGGYNWSQH